MAWQPRYRALGAQEIRHRAARAHAQLAACQLCPRHCGVNRFESAAGDCRTGARAVVASYFPHLGKEDCLRGWAGSGVILFAGCHLRCIFCQSWEISQRRPGAAGAGGGEAGGGGGGGAGGGRGGGAGEVDPPELAAMMLRLQDAGCHNVNLITPEHVLPQILAALALALEGGLAIPLVFNTSGYMSPAALALLDGTVDVYVPDFKCWSPRTARRYLRAPDYPATTRRALRLMHRQVGDLEVDAHGLARGGILLRHLVVPGWGRETDAILRWIARTLGPDTCLNLMDGYWPGGPVRRGARPELNRPLRREEHARAVRLARELGFERLVQPAPLRFRSPATPPVTLPAQPPRPGDAPAAWAAPSADPPASSAWGTAP
jgi:putative pyruvate formate lyase activating enzyme